MAWLYLLLAGMFEVRVGDRTEIHRGFFPAAPVAAHHCCHGAQPCSAGARAKRFAGWNGVRRLDRHRCCRHRSTWHLPFQRAGDANAPWLHWIDRGWDRRAEIRDLTFIKLWGSTYTSNRTLLRPLP